MIEKIEIQNFQSHKRTILELTPGLNVVIGPSDSGKSAIIRALRWLFENRPLGWNFKSSFAGKNEPTVVKVKFDDGNVVTRFRSQDHNCYRVNRRTLSAIKSKVPDEVSQVCGIPDFAIQSQFDRCFLLQDYPSEVARQLNQVTNLEVIDQLYHEMQVEMNSLRQEINRLQSQESELKYEQQKLSFVPQYRKLLARLEKLVVEYENLGAQIEKTWEILDNVEKLKRILIRLQRKLKIENFERLCTKAKLCSVLKEKLYNVKEILNSIGKTKNQIRKVESKTNLESFCERIQSLCEASYELKSRIKETSSLLLHMDTISYQLEQKQMELELKVKELSDMILETGVCPVCGSKVSEDKLYQHLRRYL